MEFDPPAMPTELMIVRYFEKNLKPSIKAEINQDATHLDNYEELVAKAVRTKAKAGLQPSFYLWEIDPQVLWGSWPAHTTVYKVQTQGAVNCGDRSKASKAPASTQKSKASDKARKNKKKRHHSDKRNSKEFKDSSPPASGVNAAEISGSG